MPPAGDRPNHLLAIKLLHTVAWAFFVAAILGIWLAALSNRFALAFTCVGIVVVEVVILALNSWHCPLTPLAARYTDDRRPNFDIFLPEWIARYNKEIFGSLFVAGAVLAAVRFILVS